MHKQNHNFKEHLFLWELFYVICDVLHHVLNVISDNCLTCQMLHLLSVSQIIKLPKNSEFLKIKLSFHT